MGVGRESCLMVGCVAAWCGGSEAETARGRQRQRETQEERVSACEREHRGPKQLELGQPILTGRRALFRIKESFGAGSPDSSSAATATSAEKCPHSFCAPKEGTTVIGFGVDVGGFGVILLRVCASVCDINTNEMLSLRRTHPGRKGECHGERDLCALARLPKERQKNSSEPVRLQVIARRPLRRHLIRTALKQHPSAQINTTTAHRPLPIPHLDKRRGVDHDRPAKHLRKGEDVDGSEGDVGSADVVKLLFPLGVELWSHQD